MKGIIVHSLSFHMKFIKLTKGNNVDNSEIFLLNRTDVYLKILKGAWIHNIVRPDFFNWLIYGIFFQI